jgi:hypothetical protein
VSRIGWFLFAALFLRAGLRLPAGEMADVRLIGDRMLLGIDHEYRRLFAEPAIVVDDSPLPFPRPGTNQVFISDAYVALVDRVATALARDGVRPGYARTCLAAWSNAPAGSHAMELPSVSGPEFETLQFRNAQATAFNQLVGMTLGLELAHHFCGQYDRHRARIASGPVQVALRSVLTESECRRAVREGVGASASAGCGIEAYSRLGELLEDLPARPPWASWWMFAELKGSALRKDLRKAFTRAVGARAR